jgi:hypothetical protein
MTQTSQPAGTVAIATIPTAHASRYLQQMAKHFQHKLPVTFDPHAGTVKFSIGDCGMAASDSALILTLVAAEATQMDQLKDVVVRHLVRFAFREELAIDWQPV